jgi:hypothetical protein
MVKIWQESFLAVLPSNDKLLLMNFGWFHYRPVPLEQHQSKVRNQKEND